MKKISKFLSLVLRHKPETIGLEMDKNGWVSVKELLKKTKSKFPELNMGLLEEVVSTNDKQRFSFNENKTKIRANQGHSIDVDLKYTEQEPPEILFHGTVDKFLKNIKNEGLQKMSRHHVHLSADEETATKVGSRRGKPVILVIESGKMHSDGIKFYKSENEVWLTDMVEPKYIKFIKY